VATPAPTGAISAALHTAAAATVVIRRFVIALPLSHLHRNTYYLPSYAFDAARSTPSREESGKNEQPNQPPVIL
jgi:hypothetical protein